VNAAPSNRDKRGKEEPKLKAATQSCARVTEDDSSGGTVVVMERLPVPLVNALCFPVISEGVEFPRPALTIRANSISGDDALGSAGGACRRSRRSVLVTAILAAFPSSGRAPVGLVMPAEILSFGIHSARKVCTGVIRIVGRKGC
jgi:hypothetical protein